MESVSFESRKVSNSSNKYDDVLSGKRSKKSSSININVEDYREIFGSRTFSSSCSSSIPVLNLSTICLPQQQHHYHDVFSSSILDYNDIFGSIKNNNNNKFNDDADADAAANVVSHEHLYGPDKTARSPSSTTSQDLDDKSHDVLKQFNMSYNKIGSKSKDMSDVTKHVTQLYSTPGYTCFIDEPKMEAKKYKSSPVHVVESVSEDKKFSHKNEMYKNDYEDDVNSDASASAAALRKAIEKAQESIRIAKESVGRKKKGLKSFSNRSCKSSIKVESGMEDISATSTSSSQGFSSFMDVEKLFGAKKVIDEINGKLSKSAHSKKVIDECVILRSEAVDTEISTSEASEFVHADQTNNNFVDDTVRFTNVCDLVKELHIFEKKVEYEKKESRGSKQEDVENIVDSVERHGKEGEDDERIEDTSENESKDDQTQEETSEIHYDVFEIEMEMEEKEKEKIFDDTFDEEYDDNLSGDDNVIEETGSIHLSGDDMVITQEVEDVTEAFREFLVEETESMKEDYASEEEEGLCEKTFIDENVLDHNEDQYEVKSEENDIKSETSSDSIHDVKTEVDEANEKTTTLDETNIQIPTQNAAEDVKVSGNENSKRIDEMTAKNNRLAVDRAIREARERAFVEARERAERERAAVEKATEEVRQRMMAEAVEKVAKASSDRTSTQSKLRAERAAVERATSEARQRALEKAMTQKSVSDLNSSESALRRKAKLDKHNRIMERAAKALAEKEKRDLLAQKEQAERNRLSENLDADIKRWSKGKEGNLRALLSTLQYILGPQSGWQPITMTEIVTSNAVKKAYRKATLCVHPDKLQQRGASIQHKYICEKVFDLLKAAWSRFNSEER